MQQTGTGTGQLINMLVPKNSIKSCQKYVKVVEYWHGTIKNYRYDEDVSLLLLLFVLDLCYTLGEEGVVTIIDDRNGEGVSTIYERRRMPTVVVEGNMP